MPSEDSDGLFFASEIFREIVCVILPAFDSIYDYLLGGR
jgi:hypothetical protein